MREPASCIGCPHCPMVVSADVGVEQLIGYLWSAGIPIEKAQSCIHTIRMQEEEEEDGPSFDWFLEGYTYIGTKTGRWGGRSEHYSEPHVDMYGDSGKMFIAREEFDIKCGTFGMGDPELMEMDFSNIEKRMAGFMVQQMDEEAERRLLGDGN